MRLNSVVSALCFVLVTAAWAQLSTTATLRAPGAGFTAGHPETRHLGRIVTDRDCCTGHDSLGSIRHGYRKRR